MKLGPFILTEVGLFIDGDSSIRDWERSCPMIFDMQKYCPWWIGDMINFGESIFGDDFWQSVPEDAPEHLLNRFASIARKYPAEKRNPNVSWTHHVTALQIKDERVRNALLMKAARDKLDNHSFKDLINEYGSERPDALV